MGEHGSVGPAAHDVVLVELLVEGDRLAEPFDGVGDAILEAPAPQLVLLGFLGVLLLVQLPGGHGLGRGREPPPAAREEAARGVREGEAARGFVGYGRKDGMVGMEEGSHYNRASARTEE